MEGGFDVITIGTATQDVFYPLPSDTFICEKGVKMEIGAPFCSTGGGAVNAAVTFARQGFKTAALFRVGADSAGESIARDMEKEGVVMLARKDAGLPRIRLGSTESASSAQRDGSRWVAGKAGEATGQSAILLYPNGERTILTHRGAADNMPLKEVPFAKLKAKWVYIASSHIAVSVMEQIIDHCYAQGILVAFNPSAVYCADRGKLLKPLLSKIKVLMVNREEAGYIIGIASAEEKEIFARLDDLVDGICVMTDGSRGVYVSDGNRLYKAGIFPDKNLISRAGAGDAFGSGFVAGMLLKEDIAYAIRLASANATAVTEHLGAHKGVVTRYDFEHNARWKTLDIA